MPIGFSEREEDEAAAAPARTVLGHRSLSATAVYVARDERVALEVAREVG